MVGFGLFGPGAARAPPLVIQVVRIGKGYKILVLSYFNIRNLRNADIVGARNKRYKCGLDVILVVSHKRS